MSFDTRTGQHPVGDISAELAQYPEIDSLDVFDRHGRIRWSSDVRRRGKMAEADLLAILAAWGDTPSGPPDLDGDGIVGIGDLLDLLAAWGPCPR